MPKIEALAELAGYRREDFSVCLGCKICGSVCTINDLSVTANPQELLMKVFLQKELKGDDPVIANCTNCYNCTEACPWKIRIPEVVRALRRELALESPFEKAFKASVTLLGRVYEPYVLLRALPFLIKEGYLAYVTRWTEYITFHLPHRVKETGLLQPGKDVVAVREPKARDRKAKRTP
jgi:heterodisulfide reductase subunit C